MLYTKTIATIILAVLCLFVEVRYENLYVQNTVCMPSRASILTGTYPCRHSLTCNGYNLPTEQTTIANVLRNAGYHTMAVGRTHVICTQPRPEYSKTDFYGLAESVDLMTTRETNMFFRFTTDVIASSVSKTDRTDNFSTLAMIRLTPMLSKMCGMNS